MLITNKFSHCFLCAICRQRGGAMRWRRKKKRLKKEKGKGQRIGDRAKGRRSIGVRKLTAREISTHTHITYIHIKCTFKFVLNATLSFQNGLTGKATLKKKKRRRKRKRRSLLDITRLAKIFKQRNRFKKSDMKEMQDIWITKTQKTSIVTQKEENRRNEVIFDII